MSNPFDWIKSINFKTEVEDLSGYVPYLTNRCFAYHIDCILLAEEMNQYHTLPPELQYDFYYHAVRKGKRYGFPPKPEPIDHIDEVMEYYQISRQKAIEALKLLKPQEIQEIRSQLNTGGS